MTASRDVSVACLRTPAARYPERPPFHPSESWPEYRLRSVSPEENGVYAATRQLLRLAGLDSDNYGRPQWNPLGDVVRPGQKVVLKPNLIKKEHPRDPRGWRYLMTHGSVIRAIADYLWIALAGRGEVILADAPQTDSSFSEIVDALGLIELRSFYRSHGLRFEIVDLRKEEWETRDGVVTARHRLAGDPRGYVKFDLGHLSYFKDHSGEGRYYGADYDAGVVNEHHSGGRHEYLISRSILEADVVINLPKLKTHKKTGITCALKNLVGINGDKNWLPHHTESRLMRQGDECPARGVRAALERLSLRQLRSFAASVPRMGPLVHRLARRGGRRVFGDSEEVIRNGNWWGNDTAWRMCLDLNRILAYGTLNGTLSITTDRKQLVLVDAILAGEGRGPLNPDPVQVGTLILGRNPACVDALAACLSGYDPEKIPMVRRAFDPHPFPLVERTWRDTPITAEEPRWSGSLRDLPDGLVRPLHPHFGWIGAIERDCQAGTGEEGLSRP